MIFLGQPTIMQRLAVYLPELRKGSFPNMSFLLKAPSGWGKTRMAFLICNYLANGDFEYCLGDNITARFEKRVVFIDEVHAIPNPEFLYPIIDSGKHILVLATNEVAVLPEALVNRCENLIFEDYSKEELRELCRINLSVVFPPETLDYIIESSSGNPRVIRNMCQKLTMMRPEILAELSIEEFKAFMLKLFGIENGLDTVSRRYLDVLERLGGTASLKTLATALHLDEGSIRFYIEPSLLYKNKITISSRGRSLVK